jgi:hypothetical protein
MSFREITEVRRALSTDLFAFPGRCLLEAEAVGGCAADLQLGSSRWIEIRGLPHRQVGKQEDVALSERQATLDPLCATKCITG